MGILVITGGSGTLGKAIIKHQELLKSYGISRIRVISRDEQKQVALMRKYTGDIPLDCFLGDVSDKERMVFALRDAHYVIHAAAQKHIDKFELDVKTGFKTNIAGTENVAQAFDASKNPKSAIFVSTDKAALPITSYGISKLAAEHVWLWHNSFQTTAAYGVVRYGNVFGSRGSVIETWTEAARRGEPIGITDPQCTRFFMMIEDAARFVIEALMDNRRPINIPEMKSIEMPAVAKMIWKYWNPNGDEMPARVTGLRGAEKVHELLKVNGKTSFEAERFTEEELLLMYCSWVKENLWSELKYTQKSAAAILENPNISEKPSTAALNTTSTPSSSNSSQMPWLLLEQAMSGSAPNNT